MIVQVDIADDEEWDDDNDYDLLDRCLEMNVHIEIGELHERDKFTASDLHRLERKKNTVFGKRSYPFEFEFKMNHIKQIVKVELIGKFTAIKSGAATNQT